MIMTVKELAKIADCCSETARTYIGRAEFSNIEITKGRCNQFVLKNVTEENILRLRQLVQKAKRKTGKNTKRRKKRT